MSDYTDWHYIHISYFLTSLKKDVAPNVNQTILLDVANHERSTHLIWVLGFSETIFHDLDPAHTDLIPEFNMIGTANHIFIHKY